MDHLSDASGYDEAQYEATEDVRDTTIVFGLASAEIKTELSRRANVRNLQRGRQAQLRISEFHPGIGWNPAATKIEKGPPGRKSGQGAPQRKIGGEYV